VGREEEKEKMFVKL